MTRPCGSLRGEQSAMMILLGAILLVAAFLALAVVVGRVGNVQDAVSRDFGDTLTPEAASIAAGIQSIATAMADDNDYCDDLQDYIEQIRSSVAQRGFLMWLDDPSTPATGDGFDCVDDDTDVTVQFGLSDGASELTRTVTVERS